MEGALLTSASEILETEGPDALSVRRIAAAASVAPMGVYNHFESKFGIVEALYVQGFDASPTPWPPWPRSRTPPRRCSRAPAPTGPSPSPTRWPTR